MKMEHVCEKTGLSEKTILLYIKENLVQPSVHESNGKETYNFSEEDVVKLQDIRYLRDSELGIEKIREMLNNPLWIPGKPEESKKKIDQEQMFHPKKINPWVRVIFLGLFVGCVWLASWLYDSRYGTANLMTIYFSFAVIFAGISIFMAFRYATVSSRGRKLPHRSTGIVRAVVPERGFSISYSRAGGGRAGTRESGIGGIWQFFFLFWNEIRLDCWYPVIEYVDEKGKQRMSTFHYGGWKHSWHENDTVEIAWDDKNPEDLYPLSGGWIQKKFASYIGLTVLFLVIAYGAILVKNWPSSLKLPEEADRVVVSYDGNQYDFTGEKYENIKDNINSCIIRKGKNPGAANENLILMDVYQGDTFLFNLKFDDKGNIYTDDEVYKVPANENQLMNSEVFVESLADQIDNMGSEKE
jgi:DNA-binding transcriptional MerR regulator